MSDIKAIVTSKHPEGEVEQAYVDRKVKAYLAGDENVQNVFVDDQENTFTIESETFETPITGAIYEKYYVVDGKVQPTLTPEQALDVARTTPSSFETMYETDTNTIREVWER